MATRDRQVQGSSNMAKASAQDFVPSVKPYPFACLSSTFEYSHGLARRLAWRLTQTAQMYTVTSDKILPSCAFVCQMTCS